MTSVVLDTSALLAFVKGEPGADVVADAIGDAVVSAVNFAEAVSVLIGRGGSLEIALAILGMAEIEIVDFDRGLAERTGALAARTRRFGLSLGDRSCLALALRDDRPVLTGDRVWSQLDIGVSVRLFR